MKTARKILFAMLLVVSLMSFTVVAHAVDRADVIAIESVMFSEYTGSTGEVDETLIRVKVGFNAVYPSEQITILVSTEDITELSNVNVGKILYIDQVDRPEEGELDFVIEKARVAAAIGTDAINGATLYVKMGGTNVETMAEKEVTLFDPSAASFIPGDVDGDEEVTSYDAVLTLRYEAGWELEDIIVEAMDVDGDDEATSYDAVLMLRYEAGWDVEFK